MIWRLYKNASVNWKQHLPNVVFFLFFIEHPGSLEYSHKAIKRSICCFFKKAPALTINLNEHPTYPLTLVFNCVYPYLKLSYRFICFLFVSHLKCECPEQGDSPVLLTTESSTLTPNCSTVSHSRCELNKYIFVKWMAEL